MLRYGRLRFFVFGVVPALNAIALLLFGLGLATNGAYGTERAVPLLLVLAAVCLLATSAAVVKRGRDFGWKASASLAGFVLSVALVPMILFFIGYLTFVQGSAGANAFGPVPPPASAMSWALSAAMTVILWVSAVSAARLM